MAQVLPADEDFAAPGWALNVSSQSQPWFWWYMGFDPSGVIASGSPSSSSCPFSDFSTVGSMNVEPSVDLYIPLSGFGGGFPAIMADTTGINSDLTQRAVLSRVGTTQDDTSHKVVFGLRSVGDTQMGSSQDGRGGSGPGPNGGQGFPAPDPSFTGDDHDTVDSGDGGGYITGGHTHRHETAAEPPTWTAWNGNAIFFRCSTAVASAIQGSTTKGTERYWHYRGMDFYAFYAYPVVNSGASTVDLYLELWHMKCPSNTRSSSNVPRLVMQQVVDDGASVIDFRQPYHLRVTVDTSASDVDMTAFIGKYINPTTSAVSSEVQCFKAGVFANDTFTTGTSVTQNSSTGVITDSHADNITAFADTTFGWSMGLERRMDVQDRMFASAAVPINVQEGIYSVAATDATVGTVLYADEFERVGFGPKNSFAGSWLIPGAGRGTEFGVQGHHCQGMFTGDGYAETFSSDNALIDRLMIWGLNTSSTAAQDYVQLGYSPQAVGGPENVMRSFIYERPSTQFYNHHRSVTFKVGAATADSPISPVSFELGVILRGSATGESCAATVAYIAWSENKTTNALTYWSLRIAERTATYTDADPDGSTLSETVIASKTYSTGSGAPSFNDGSTHTLDFRAESVPSASGPGSAAIYHIEYDGSPIELDDTSPPYQSNTTSPYAVIQQGPLYYSGKTEGFWFLADTQEFESTLLTPSWSRTQISGWTEGALTADPTGGGDADTMASIVVGGEGTSTGSLNTSSGALGISGSGVWDVETTVDVEFFWPKRHVQFDSGHAYTGPKNSQARRRWRVTVHAADKSVYQALLTFFNDHNGPEIPFSFVVPIPNDGTDTGSVAESTETVTAWFADDTMGVSEIGPEVYSIAFSIEEHLVA